MVETFVVTVDYSDATFAGRFFDVSNVAHTIKVGSVQLLVITKTKTLSDHPQG